MLVVTLWHSKLRRLANCGQALNQIFMANVSRCKMVWVGDFISEVVSLTDPHCKEQCIYKAY